MHIDKKNIKASMLAGATAGLNNCMQLVSTPATLEFCHSSTRPDYIEAEKNRGIIRYIALDSMSNFTSRLMACRTFKLSSDVQTRKIVIGTLVTTKSGVN